MATSGSFSTSVHSGHYELRVDWSASQSITNNTSTITAKIYLVNDWALDISGRTGNTITIDGKSYSFSSSEIRTTGTHLLATITSDPITHNSDGSKSISMSCSWKLNATISGTPYKTMTASANVTLDTIPRKSTLSVGNGTLGTAQTLTVTQQASSFKHSIKAVCGSSTLYIKADGTTSTSEVKHNDCSISFTPPLSWASQNTTGTSLTVKYTITTYNGSAEIGSNAYTKTCSIPTSVKPTIALDVSDAMGYLETFGGYVQGQSKFKIVVTASGSYGSTIKAYKTTADGKTYTKATITSGIVSNSGTLTISATVTDSRGRTANISQNVSVLPYEMPKISSLNCYRSDENGAASSSGEHLAVVFSSDVTPLNNKNSVAFEFRYKKSTVDEYTVQQINGDYSVSDGVYIFAADKNSSYNITFVVTDSFTSATKTTIGASIKKRFSILKAVFGFAIGKIAELPNVFDIALQTRFLGGILHPVLEPNTDLNDIKTPNIYVGANVSTNNYLNCPLTTGTFTLEVVGMGEDGQCKQRLTYCHKTASRTWERIYHSTNGVMSWGDWVCVSDFDGQLLWSDALYMQEGHVITLPEPISHQKSGIVLVFSGYDGGENDNDYSFSSHFIPKKLIELQGGKTFSFMLTSKAIDLDLLYLGAKTLFISDSEIRGVAVNSKETDMVHVYFHNSRFVLRYVIGV